MQLNYFKSLEMRRKAETKLLELLGAFADNLHEPREVTFWFFGEEYDVYRLAAIMKEKGFEIVSVVQTQTAHDEFLLIGAKWMVVKDDSFLDLTSAMDDLASAYNCRYDGHEMEL
ncbi:ribonuclease E inhibitor RraB [bacterium]|nr:MAG: ribonuclease E inhibitor RraB [bacterium]